MNLDDQNEAEKRKRARAAASILRRLDENPEDTVAMQDREAFLARGAAERRIYNNVERAFSGAKKGLRNKDHRNFIALVVAMLASLYFVWEPTRLVLLADHQTGYLVERITLASGDSVILDASSAISDNSDDQIRTVNLLQGGGYFNIKKDERSFLVKSGSISVEVIGTEFEVSQLNNTVLITVAEGLVQVRSATDEWTLNPGERLRVSQNNAEQLSVDKDTVAGWRQEQLSMDGMTLQDVTSIIGRRSRGKIIVLGEELRSLEVTGRLNLSNSSNALETIAAASSADVYQITPYLTVLSPK